MTKLFSMKSLAFAGAAAFALTLAAAPQADAAEKLTLNVNDLSKVKAEDTSELTNTEDGNVIYYQVAKTEDKIKDGKYTAITDENLGYFNFSKFAGKANYLSISPDGTKDAATGVAIKAAPKVKATYDATNGLQLTIDKTEATITSESAIGPVYATAGGKKYQVFGVNTELIKSNSVLGGTLGVTVEEVDSTDGVASLSAAAKLKIAAKAKAPKVSLKLDAAKAFTWKISDKQEYKITVGTESSAEWVTGSKNADTWASIVENGISKEVAASAVSGDAITADVTISLRTKADKKAASAISVTKLAKSAASPTGAAVTVATTKASGKTATGASIKAVTDIQYSTDDGAKWKKLAAGKEAKLKDETVLVRTPGASKNGFVLPSLNTTITVDYTTGKATVSSLDYSDSGIVATTETVEAK